MKNYLTKKSYSVFTSAAIHSMRMRTFSRRKTIDRLLHLGGLDDRAPFKIAGAIVEVEKKFTRKEGKPFAVFGSKIRADMLEVVVWNEVYLKVSAALVAGRVIEIKGTLDKRDEIPRAVAQEIRTISPRKPNGASEGSTDKEAAVLCNFLLLQPGMNYVRCAGYLPVRRAGDPFDCCSIAQTATRCAWKQVQSLA